MNPCNKCETVVFEYHDELDVSPAVRVEKSEQFLEECEKYQYVMGECPLPDAFCMPAIMLACEARFYGLRE